MSDNSNKKNKANLKSTQRMIQVLDESAAIGNQTNEVSIKRIVNCCIVDET